MSAIQQEKESTREILRKVRRIEIRSRRQIDEALAGAYKSVFRGTGIDFEEVREYAPGDDIRSIDWNVTAKMDRPFVKRFREERELTIMLMVDVSASGHFGSGDQSKRELAAEFASLLAFSATRNNDKVGLILFSDKIEKVIPPQKGRMHVLRVIREILFFKPEQKGTSISEALKLVNHILKRKAVCFLISDFLTNELHDNEKNNPLIRLLQVTNQHHDLICAVLEDPREIELPNVGTLCLQDAESGEVFEVDTRNKKVRDRYRAWNEFRRESLSKILKQSGIDRLILRTNEPYLPALRRFFSQRTQRS